MSSPPFARLDHLVIAVRDLDAAAGAYAAVLGRAASWRGTHPTYGTANVIFGLDNCYLELLALGAEPAIHPVATALAAYLERHAEGLFALAFGSDDLDAAADHLRSHGLHPGPIADGHAQAPGSAVRRWRSFPLPRTETRGVNVFAIAHDDRATIAPAAPSADPQTIVTGVDHVVVFSDDLGAALTLWGEAFRIPERWRREFPDRGTVNVGLRLGGVTFELVGPLAGASGTRGERTWGLAYDVTDVDAAVTRLRANGIPVSEARTGLAPATRVCTVKWRDGVPTLLIEHQARAGQSAPPARV